MAAPAWGTRERPWPIAVSTLDAWKWFNQSEMTDEEFRHRLEHQDKPTVEAQVGQALHRAVEVLMMDVRTGGPVSLQSLVGMHREEPDVSFLFALDSGLDINLDHCMIVEQDVQWTINTGLGWVTLRGHHRCHPWHSDQGHQDHQVIQGHQVPGQLAVESLPGHDGGPSSGSSSIRCSCWPIHPRK